MQRLHCPINNSTLDSYVWFWSVIKYELDSNVFVSFLSESDLCISCLYKSMENPR